FVPFVLRLKTYAAALLSGTLNMDNLMENSLDGFDLDTKELIGLRKAMQQREGVFVIDGIDYLRDKHDLCMSIFGIVENYFAGANSARVIITTRERSDLLGAFQDFEYFTIEPIRQ